MKKMKLTRSFFERPTLVVAKNLLGKYLVRKTGGRLIEGMIVETEAYCGPKDLASHASRGRTARTEVMFGRAAFAYVYLVYGMHHCFNIVTEKENYPAAVLIRGVKIDDGRLISGPGRVCRFFKIDRRSNKQDLVSGGDIWLEDRGVKPNPERIKHRSRIGVDYAGEYKDKLWRFILI